MQQLSAISDIFKRAITEGFREKLILPLISHEVIVNLIGSTTAQNGLTISAALDTNLYPKGIRVSDDELEMVNLIKAPFHGEWNYTIDKNCSG